MYYKTLFYFVYNKTGTILEQIIQFKCIVEEMSVPDFVYIYFHMSRFHVWFKDIFGHFCTIDNVSVKLNIKWEF